MSKILFFVVLIAAFNYLIYWAAWCKGSKWRCITMFIAHLIGFLSLVLLGYGFHLMPDGIFRTMARVLETVYFSMIALCGSCFVIYLPIYFITFKKTGKIAKILSNKKMIVGIVTAACFIITLIGLFRIDDIHLTSYKVHSDKTCTDSTVRIAAIGDTHLGAGAGKDAVEKTFDIINDMDADVLLLLGDITDETSSKSDVEFFIEELKKVDTKYGIYSVTGNHDGKCKTDITAYLRDAGVKIIDGEAVELPNGLILSGQPIYSTITVGEVLKESGISSDGKPVVLLRHDPREFERYDGDADMIFCGHTHGLRYPMVAISQAYYFDMSYGIKTYPQGLNAITTSGVSAWGFHFKWPAISEVVQVDMTFGSEK